MERSQTVETRTYRWTCPICETAQLGVYDVADSFRAVNALQTHIRSTNGNGHGPVHELPATVDLDTLTNYVSHR